jgi:WD40 repeat protein
VSQSEKNVRIVDLETGRLRQQFAATNGFAAISTFAADGKVLVTDSGDGTALVWDLTQVPRANSGAKEVPR